MIRSYAPLIPFVKEELSYVGEPAYRAKSALENSHPTRHDTAVETGKTAMVNRNSMFAQISATFTPPLRVRTRKSSEAAISLHDLSRNGTVRAPRSPDATDADVDGAVGPRETSLGRIARALPDIQQLGHETF
jgi:hypothetical protein